MKICERCKTKFSNVLQYIAHKNTFKHQWKPMDPAVKDAIVTRIEDRLRPFLLGHGVKETLIVLAASKKEPVKIVIERFESSLERFVAPHDLVGVAQPNWVG